MALMTIKNKQAMGADCTRLCVGVKVLQLLNSKLVSCLSIVTNCNYLVAWDCCLLVPGREVVLAGQDEERRDCLPSSVDRSDECRPLTIAWLESLWPASPL
jgi:hypothetical protein